jgi:hypothetical protein
MYAIPQLMTVPALTGVGVMTTDWPTLGVFLAWTLIAALVGTGLGALRRLGTQPPAIGRPHAVPPRVFAASTHVADHNHLEAA